MKKIPNMNALTIILPCILLFLCNCDDMLLLNPKGPIGESVLFLILVSFGLMLLVVIPVIIMSIWFPLKYRAGNTNAKYAPTWNNSKKIEIVVWMIPFAIVLTLSILVIIFTHKLDPYIPIESNKKSISIEVISLDWKWLFIYPEENIAVVNQIAFPAKTPLSFRITATTAMTSFFIPQLGSQIYGMAGMQTRLHLLANAPDTFVGQNQQYSGLGYSGMFFNAIAASEQGFQEWIEKVKRSPDTLTWARYRLLEKPSVADSVIFFSAVEPGMFDSIMYMFDPTMKNMKNCH